MRSPGTVEKHDSLDVCDLNRVRALRNMTVMFTCVSLRWPWMHQLRTSQWRAELQFYNGLWQTIPVVWTRCHFGGWRPWFQCPFCKRRVGKLYNGGSFCACRPCCNLRYASQRRGAKSRRYLQALKLRLRLGGVASIAEPFPERPRGMRKSTYLRLRRRAERLEQDVRQSKRLLGKKPDYSILVPK